jgi:hypothetical protein
MDGRQIRRTQHDAARHSVKLKQCERCGQLALADEEYALVAQLLQPSAEHTRLGERGQIDYAMGTVQPAQGARCID